MQITERSECRTGTSKVFKESNKNDFAVIMPQLGVTL